MGTFTQDLRFGARTLLRAPGFTLISILTLALGIGATSVVFSFIAAVLGAATPVADMDRRAGIWSHNRTQGEAKNVVSVEDFVEWQRRQRSFDRFAAQRNGAVNLSGAGAPIRAGATFVTADFFDVLGQHPVLGRPFRPDDQEPGAQRVAILSNTFWRDRFNRRADVLGSEILIDGRATTIVGVLPANDFTPELVLPLTIDPSSSAYREHSLFVSARLRDGVTLEQARADMTAIGDQLEREVPDTHRGWGVNTRPLQEEFVGPQARLIFALLFAAATAVLLIGCANIANLLLARGIGRAREFAMRAALGASRARLIRQLLVESLVLGLSGAAAGLVVAHWGLVALRGTMTVGVQSITDRMIVDGRVLAFAALASITSTLLFGLVPALQGVRGDVNQTLRDGSRSTGGARTRRLRALLVTGEVAAAVLFLVVAMLFMRTLTALQRIEPGFDTTNMLTLRVALPDVRYTTDASVTTFYERVLERLRASQGVIDAGAAVRMPAAGSRYNPNRSVVIEGRPPVEGQTRFAADLTVTPGYLETLRIPLRAGRGLSAADGADAPLAVVISDAMVRRYWDGVSDRALGARIRLGDEASPDSWRTIVGIVGDVRNDDIDSPPLPMVYVPLAQRSTRDMTIVLRTRDDPMGNVTAARAAIAAVDADQPVYEIKSMTQILDEDLRQSVIVIAILGIFAAVALLLAALGIYGVVAHAVAQRTHEIGVRMALGAAVRDVIGLVMRQGFTPVIVGLVIGVTGGLGVSRLMRSVLYGVTPTDPLTYGTVTLLLAAVALTACIVPASRAARIDPLRAIRSE